jgi:hypothetical protein
MANTTHEKTAQERDRDARDKDAPAKETTRETLERRNKEEIENFKMRDDLLRKQATQGIPDEETRDKVLAMGGDASRASPVSAQVLPDIEPGLTTTTGAYRTPIDPTTAAVPAPEFSERVERMRGAPTVGSAGPGQGEELFAEPKDRPFSGPAEARPGARSETRPAPDARPATR